MGLIKVKQFAPVQLTPPKTPSDDEKKKPAAQTDDNHSQTQQEKLDKARKALPFRFAADDAIHFDEQSSDDDFVSILNDATAKPKKLKCTTTKTKRSRKNTSSTETGGNQDTANDKPKTNKKKKPKRERSASTTASTNEPSTSSKSKTPGKRPKKFKFDTPPVNNKSILDFFAKTPKIPQLANDIKPITSTVVKEKINIYDQSKTKITDEIIMITSDDENDRKEVAAKVPVASNWTTAEKENQREKDPKIVIPRARRKLCPGTDLRMVSNRYHDEGQKRLTNFYEKTNEEGFSYHTTVSKSVAPVIIDGNMDVEQFLKVDIAERSQVIKAEDLEPNIASVNMATVSDLVDRIVNPRLDDEDIEREMWNMEEFNLPIENLPIDEDSRSAFDNPVQFTACDIVENVKPTKRRGRVNKTTGNRKQLTCPKYKIISGTTFVVDGFRFGKIAGATHYFLTHFHSDHYIGLKKTFDMPLICSSITARLIDKFIHVDPQYIIILDVGESITINDIKIFAMDANHCPGAVMFLFKLPNGDAKLHVGDFRASDEMESYPLFWNHDITELYLDTTYFNCRYNLMTQSQCIAICLEEVRKFLDKNNFNKPLIVVGGYLIGKEKVWIDIAKKFKLKVWADRNRRMALEAINNPEELKLLVNDPKKATLHLVGLGIVNYDDMKQYLANFSDTFSHILGIRPSGWEKKSKPRHQGMISIVGVEYSEHSSYDELKRFVNFLRPTTIISTVPIGKDPNKTPTIPPSWYQGEIKPTRDKATAQLKISELLSTAKKSNASVKNEVTDMSTPINKQTGRVLEMSNLCETPSGLTCVFKEKTATTPLNPSVRNRREKFKENVDKFKVLEEIELGDSDYENKKGDTEETDWLP